MKTEIVYHLHFISPIHHAQHYIGSCKKRNLYSRLKLHAEGKSHVKIVDEFHRRRIPFVVVNLWDGDKKTERHMKLKKNGRQLCTICRDKRG